MPGRTTRFGATGGSGGGGSGPGHLHWGPDFGNNEDMKLGPVADISYSTAHAFLFDLISQQDIELLGEIVGTLPLGIEEQLHIIYQLGALFPLQAQGDIDLTRIQVGGLMEVSGEAVLLSAQTIAGLAGIVQAQALLRSLGLAGSLQEPTLLSGAYGVRSLLLSGQGEIGITNITEAGSLAAASSIAYTSAASGTLIVVADGSISAITLGGTVVSAEAVQLSGLAMSGAAQCAVVTSGAYSIAALSATAQVDITSPAVTLAGLLQSQQDITEPTISIGSLIEVVGDAMLLSGQAIAGLAGLVQGDENITSLALAGGLQDAIIASGASSLSGLSLGNSQASVFMPSLAIVGTMLDSAALLGAYGIGGFLLSTVQGALAGTYALDYIEVLQAAVRESALSLSGSEIVQTSETLAVAEGGVLSASLTESGGYSIGPPNQVATLGDIFGGSNFGSSYFGGASFLGDSLWIPQAREQMLLVALQALGLMSSNISPDSTGIGLTYTLDYIANSNTGATAGVTFTVPSGVTSISAKCWSGGGGGGTSTVNGGGGGAGGGFASGTIAVTAGGTTTIRCGTANGVGLGGVPSFFKSGSNTITVNGGDAGGAGSAGGAGAGGTAGTITFGGTVTNQVSHVGGTGAAGSGTNGGGGGGGAGDANVGGNASGGSGGSAGTAGGGAGGSGSSGSTSGSNAGANGGGGGGASTLAAGHTGAKGETILTMSA